jgi:hypothetical protein
LYYNDPIDAYEGHARAEFIADARRPRAREDVASRSPHAPACKRTL